MTENDPMDNNPNIDIAKIIRSQSLSAARMASDQMTRVMQVQELPLAAVLEGGGWAKRVFKKGFNPRLADSYNLIAYAKVEKAGLDMVRFDYAAGGGKMVVLEGRGFYFILPPASIPESLYPTMVRIEKALNLEGPDEQGWFSSNPDVPAQRLRDWRERIDAYAVGGRRALLVFKIGVSARQFNPSSVWF